LLFSYVAHAAQHGMKMQCVFFRGDLTMRKSLALLVIALTSSMVFAWNDGGGTSVGSATNPEAITKGTYNLTADKFFTVTNDGTINKTGSGTNFGWSLTPQAYGWGEGGIYYAFSVPANYVVSLTGTFQNANMDSSGEYWSEVCLYKAANLKAAVVGVGLNQVNDSTYAAALASGGGTTQGMWNAGYDYYMYAPDEASDGLWQALFGYSGNAENLLQADSAYATGGQPIAAYTQNNGQPTSPTDFSALAYSWDAGLQRPMKDSLLATASDTVTANDATTQYVLFLKGGAEGAGVSSMDYSNVVLTVVPEPCTIALLAIGGCTIAAFRRKRG
jgi:hypothetical protein